MNYQKKLKGVFVERKVIDNEKEDIELTIKRFNKLVSQEGIIDCIRNKFYYKKPSVLKNEKRRRIKKLIQSKKNKNKNRKKKKFISNKKKESNISKEE